MVIEGRNTGNEQDYHWAREFEFGDSHASTHHFVEKALVRAPKEVGCALAASLLVSPLMSIIDKCIVQDILGTRQFMAAMGTATGEMFFAPKTFCGSKAFLLTFAVYFGTYATANLSELMLDVNKIENDEQRKTTKVSATSVANISLLAWRDSIFARDFSGGPPQPTPIRTIGLFAARDSATMYATFYLAPVAANHLIDKYSWDRNVAELSMALGIPVVTQFVTAPWHIHAMDYYNNPRETVSTAKRLAAIRKQFNTVAFARGLRILPAFGIGSFSNNKFREWIIRQENEELLLQKRVTRLLEKRLSRTHSGSNIIQRKITEKGLIGGPPREGAGDEGARPNKSGLV